MATTTPATMASQTSPPISHGAAASKATVSAILIISHTKNLNMTACDGMPGLRRTPRTNKAAGIATVMAP
ncbi:hypothetical protein D3C72_2146510 [compost metagenome]